MSTESKRTIFVDVDTQEDFVAADGRLSVKYADRLRPVFAALTQYAQRERIPILSSADAHTPDDPEFGAFPPHCIAGSDGAKKVDGTTIETAVTIPPDGVGLPERQPAQVILEKTTFSLFSNPAADEYLGRFGPVAAVVYGVATDYCVRQAVEGLLDRGLDVSIVTDAVAAVAEEGARDTFRALGAAGVHFVTSSDVLEGRHLVA